MRTITTILIVLAALSFTAKGNAEFKGITGLYGGYSAVLGTYNPELKNSFSGGLFIYFFQYRFLNFEFMIDASRYSLEESTNSYLLDLSFAAGAAANFQVSGFLSIYGGLFPGIHYLNLDAEHLDTVEQTSRPSITAIAGFQYDLTPGLSARLWTSYTVLNLSGELLQKNTYYCGAAYNFLLSSKVTEKKIKKEREKLKREVEYIRLLRKGEKLFREKNTDMALDTFQRANKISPQREEAQKYIADIQKLNKEFTKAEKYRKNNDYYAAIEKLNSLKNSMNKASQTLKELRASLTEEVKRMEKEGIRAYEAKQYDKCIAIMKKIILIDPDNGTAAIYLPRAVKRRNVLKNLE